MSVTKKIAVGEGHNSVCLEVYGWHEGDVLPDLAVEDWRDRADDVADNDIESVYAFWISGERTLYLNCDQSWPVTASVCEHGMAEHLLTCFEPEESDEEWLASFGLDPFYEGVLEPAGFSGR